LDAELFFEFGAERAPGLVFADNEGAEEARFIAHDASATANKTSCSGASERASLLAQTILGVPMTAIDEGQQKNGETARPVCAI